MTDDYSKLKDDLVFRKEVAIRVGLGFELPSKKTEDGPNGPKIETKPISKMAAWFDSREISGAPGEIRTPDPLLRRCGKHLDDMWPALFFYDLRVWCCEVFGMISVRSAPKVAPMNH